METLTIKINQQDAFIHIKDIQVDYVDHMGSDLSVVDAARVSFNKVSAWENNQLSAKDEKLIKYLAEHNHWTPFGHATLKIRVLAPIFVARQLVKHQIGLVWNEVSRRYVSDDLSFYFPEYWRKAAENVKQGSSKEQVNIKQGDKELIISAVNYYYSLLDQGVCTEQARMILPLNLMTEWIWTGSLYAFARVCNLRLDSHAQQETSQVAEKISLIAKELFPVSWKYLLREKK